jgi:hypothetical protein
MYSSFPDKDIPGPTYDFVTAKARVRRPVGKLMAGSAVSWIPDTPYDGGPAWRLNGEASYRVMAWLKVGGQAGQRWSSRGTDRTFWDIGATMAWKQLSLDVRYADTNLGFAACGGVNWCEAGVSATLQVDLWK